MVSRIFLQWSDVAAAAAVSECGAAPLTMTSATTPARGFRGPAVKPKPKVDPLPLPKLMELNPEPNYAAMRKVDPSTLPKLVDLTPTPNLAAHSAYRHFTPQAPAVPTSLPTDNKPQPVELH